MPQPDINRLHHILESAFEAQEFMKGVSREQLPKDRKTMQAVIRNLEIIGEAAAKLSKEFKEKHNKVPWQAIVGMRNWLIHAYFDIDYDHVWNAVHEDIPTLIPQIEALLNEH